MKKRFHTQRILALFLSSVFVLKELQQRDEEQMGRNHFCHSVPLIGDTVDVSAFLSPSLLTLVSGSAVRF